MNNIYFWFDSPPKVGKGAFNFIANHWPGKVYYIFNNDFRAERKACNWNDGDFGRAEIIALYECKDEEETIKNVFVDNPNSIHIINGFGTLIVKKIQPYILVNGIKLLVFSERPVLMGSFIERMIRNIYFKYKYSKLCKMFQPFTSAFLPLGMLGVKTFASYGWQQDILYPFMYNPLLDDLSNKNAKKVSKQINFLYIGRFFYKTKGIDVLMKATNFLHGDWQLDLVGGYGNNAEEVIAWAKDKGNVNYIGRWNSMEVVEKMQSYDIVVVPTKYDGWNLLCNEALHAGIAVITTDEAVSHEIIAKSKAGKVVPSKSPKKMAEVMQFAIDHPDDVENWKQNGRLYVKNISSDTVGQYLMDIITYSIYKVGDRPQCPWL